ncbi:hypothetical protein H7U32_08945 [Bifidobacterium pullorum subsp. saeculare]|uniref:Uncharacterized protein n=1 Tax=Bifidobacterium pullorum subsp. saeculare TaxID=78257 RepID=A0A939BAD5_9BIFI|nr:hypothetical protein [Bifidobacterium pullorum]MBM6700414.1 hypothetical protein [Bifidobacterium pullorum subsp. saeculare]
MSVNTRTRTGGSRDWPECRHGRSRAAGAAPFPCRPARASRRLAVPPPTPGGSRIPSRMTPLRFFDALTYSSLNLRMTCRLAATLIPSSIRPAKQATVGDKIHDTAHITGTIPDDTYCVKFEYWEQANGDAHAAAMRSARLPLAGAGTRKRD